MKALVYIFHFDTRKHIRVSSRRKKKIKTAMYNIAVSFFLIYFVNLKRSCNLWRGVKP